LRPYERYEEYCKSLGLTAASQEDYENTLDTFFRWPKKDGTLWDEHNSLAVLTWPKNVSRPEKNRPDESKDKTKLRAELNRAFRDVGARDVISGPDGVPTLRHRYLIADLKDSGKWSPSWERYKNVLPDHSVISNWKGVALGASTPIFQPYAQLLTDQFLTLEYSDYGTVLASLHEWVNARPKPKTLLGYVVKRLEEEYRPPTQRWKAASRRLRIWRRLCSGEKYRWVHEALLRRIMAEWPSCPITYKGCGRTELITRHKPNVVPLASCSSMVPLVAEQLYRGSQFADGYQTVKLVYGYNVTKHGRFILGHVAGPQKQSIHYITFEKVDMSLRFVPDDNVSLKLYKSSALGCISVPEYRPQPENDEERARHKFFRACGKYTFPVPAFPIVTNEVYLRLKKTWRNGGPYPDSAKLYIGRVISRDRYPDETNKQWAVLSMRQAESFVVGNLRVVDFGSKDWLAWTERYYALKDKPLPLIPDGLDDGTAWERDGNGQYVYQVVAEVCGDYGTTLAPVVEGWDDVESYIPVEKWRGQ